MSRDAAIWTMMGLIVISSLALGFLRVMAIARAYRNIYVDLKKAGIELSQTDLRALFGRLYRNPRAVLSGDTQDVSGSVKEQHVQALLSRLRYIRYGFVVLVIGGIVAVLLFPHLWPQR